MFARTMQSLLIAFLVSGIMLPWPIACAQEGLKEKVIAVADFVNHAGQEHDYLIKAIPNSILTNLAKVGQLKVVEREQLAKALEELGLSREGVVDERTAAKVGRFVGATVMIYGDFFIIENEIRINARLVDVETALVISGEIVQGPVGRGVFELIDKLSALVIKDLKGYVELGPAQNDKAYGILKELAEKKKSQRMLSAAISAGVGIALGITVGALASAMVSSDEAALIGLIPAGIGIGFAVWQLTSPSEPEQELLKISALPPDQREERCAIILEQLAEKAYRGRMISAAVNAALALVSLVFPDSKDGRYDRVASFILGMSSAAYKFFFPTDEEKAYQTYKKLISGLETDTH